MTNEHLQLLRPSAFAIPEHLSDVTSWHGHLPFAFWCVDVLHPRVLVELGTHEGDSYFAFCQAVEARGLPAVCYAVGTWQGDERAGRHDRAVWEQVHRHNGLRYGRFSRLIRSAPDEAHPYFADGSVDLLHLYGLQTHDQVKRAFETWLPKLSDRAVVLLHDTNVRENGFFVWRYWSELCARYPHFSFVHGQGLGVLAVGSEVPAEVLRLCALEPAEQERVRVEFSRLGDAVTATSARIANEQRLAALQAEVEQRRPQVAALEGSLAQRRSELAEAQASLAAEVSARAGEQEAAKAQWQRVVALEAEAARQQQILAAQASDLAQKQHLSLRLLQRKSLAAQLRRSPFLLPLKLLLWLLTGRLRGELRRRREVREIEASGLFDLVWYLQRHPQVEPTAFAAITDSMVPGTGRNPNPWFDSAYYWGQSPDVAAAGLNPLLHFVRHGAGEGRDPHPLFDTRFYIRNCPDVAASGINPLLHFLQHGLSEGRTPHPSLVAASPLSLSLHALGITPSPPPPDGSPEAPALPAAVPETPDQRYQRWVQQYGSLNFSQRALLDADLTAMKLKPLISIVMPAYNSDEKWLRRAVESVRAQLYPHWELCIVDDCSPAPHVRPLLAELQKLDARIKLTLREKNGGIAAASNTAIDAATGEFLAFVDHDDEIPETALYYVASEINRCPDADFLYSDQDKIDLEGKRFDPYFKPDFNPDLLRSQNYVDHLAVFRAALVRKLGKLRPELDGSQDYDLVLRTVEASSAERIRHIPHVLYHWRAVPGSIAADVNAKSTAAERSREALRQHVARTRLGAEVTSDFPQYSIHRLVHPVPAEQPLVSVVIPTRDKLFLLEPCVDDLLHKTAWENLEILIVDNGSAEAETIAYLARIAANPKVRVLKHEGKFDYSAINNRAVEEARGSVLCLLNNDIRVINADWLREMVSHALRPEIGAVGARLYYANDTVQHGGVFLGYRGLAGHLFRYARRESMAQWARCMLTQNLTAVTAACMVVRRSVFEEVGGFSADFTVTFNDVDLCLRIRERGYRNVYAPHAELYHLESMTRGNLAHQHEEDLFAERWAELIADDPAYNPNLSLTSEDFAPAFPPRARRPWRTPLLRPATNGVEGAARPLVSIVTRTHGEREQYLREAIESVCRQTWRPLELLVVEDGPSKAREVIGRLAVPDGVTVRHLSPGKVGRCRAGNAAIEAASGKYVCFLDDDDLLLPGHAEALARVLEEKPELAAAYANAWEIPTVTRSLRPLDYQERSARLFQGHPFSLSALWDYNYVSIQSVLFRRSLFEKFGGLEEQLDCLEDWDLWLRYSAEADFAFVDQVTSIFRTPADTQILSARRKVHLGYLPTVRERQRALFKRYQGTPFEARLGEAGATVLREQASAQPQAR